MSANLETAARISEFLLQIKAIKLQPHAPFTWASGIKSPIYCDNRQILSFPRVRTFVRLELVKLIEENFGRPDVIAGVATGGIAVGVLTAQDLGLPFIYVRPKAKDHGTGSQIEGHVESGQSVIVVEDLVSTGKSSLMAVDVLREKGCTVKGMVSIFTYNLAEAADNFKQQKCKLVPLSNYDALIKKAAETGYIKEADLKLLKEWKKDPTHWQQTVQ
jgi:orotate phosphoribosyltransferase